LDPDQPRIFNKAKRKTRFRHYFGLRQVERKLRLLCQSHDFETMSSVVGKILPTMQLPVESAAVAEFKPTWHKAFASVPGGQESEFESSSVPFQR